MATSNREKMRRSSKPAAQARRKKIPVKTSPSRAAPKVTLESSKASYIFRFSGFFRFPPTGQSAPHHLVGVGRFALVDDSRTLVGEQRATFVPLFNSGLKLQHSRYQLKGKCALGADGTGTVSIDFHKFDDVTKQFSATPDMFGGFAVCYFGPMERPTAFWLISSSTTKNGKPIDEMVSGEATLVA